MTFRPLTWILIAAALLIALGFLFLDSGVEGDAAELPVKLADMEAEAEERLAARTEPEPTPEPEPEVAPTRSEAAPTRAPAPVAVAEPEPVPVPDPVRVLEGRVLDPTGRPLADLGIAIERAPERPDDAGPANLVLGFLRKAGIETGAGKSKDEEDAEPDARSDASGAFRVRLPKKAGRQIELELVAGDHTLLVEPVIEVLESSPSTVEAAAPRDSSAGSAPETAPETVVRTLPEEVLLVAAPAVRFAGRVVDQNGAPVAGASVALELPDSALHEFPAPLDRSRPIHWRATTDAAGRFALESAPSLAGSHLRASAQGCDPASLEAPAPGAEELLVTLVRNEAPEDPQITGVVLQPDGTPAKGALVRVFMDSVKTNERGEFRLDLPRGLLPDRPLVASHRGTTPAIVERFGELVEAHLPYPPPPQVLRLGDGELAISGRLVDADDEPVRGWIVTLADPTVVSQWRFPQIVVEREDATEDVQTDEEGRFEVEGLLPRSYVLRAYDLRTLASVESEPIPAGTGDAVLRLPADLYHDAVEGVVRSRGGAPVEGAHVSIDYYTSRTDSGSTSITSRGARTDASGRFRLERVPRSDVHFAVSGDRLIPLRQDLEPDADPLAIELEVALRTHFRLTLHGRPADSSVQIKFVDAAGDDLRVMTFQAGGWSSSTLHTVPEDGRTGTLSTSEDAHEIVVLEEYTNELHRQPVRLDPAIEINDVVVDLR